MPKEKPRYLMVTKCVTCPCRVEKESHGPCDSDYWDECAITELVVGSDEGRLDWEMQGKLFPKTCPLKTKV
jgi:hypothetical protein